MWAVQAALSNLRSKNCAGTNTGDLNARNVAGDAILWTVLKLQFANFGTDTCTKTFEFAMSCLPLPHTIPSLEGECMQTSHDHCIEGLNNKLSVLQLIPSFWIRSDVKIIKQTTIRCGARANCVWRGPWKLGFSPHRKLPQLQAQWIVSLEFRVVEFI